MNRFNPDMMILAREWQGTSQSALAEALGWAQGTISRFESGLNTPNDAHLVRIAKVLDRPLSFFFLNERMYGASSMFHRRRKNLTITEEKRIHAQVNELRIRASILLREAEVESRFAFHRLPLGPGGPEKAARLLRQLWQLPGGPIRSVVAATERAGGIVFRCPFGTDKVDGISQWPLDSDHVPPVLFVREDCPGDRQRFTLSHEIGHLVMHHLPTDDPESEADRFASEFLMPADEIASELGDLDLQKAAALKCYWRVSMASIIRRAHTLEKITERQYRYLNVEMSKRGYRKCEPVPIPAEEPALFKAILDVHKVDHSRTPADLSDLLGMFEHQFRREFWQSSLGLRIAG